MARPSLRLLAPLVIVLLFAAGCSRPATGDAYRFSADQLKPGELAMTNGNDTEFVPPTTPAAPPISDVPVVPGDGEIATANVPEVEVFTTKPGGPSSKPAVVKTSNLPPIPRDGYATAGVRKTANGYAFTNPTYFKSPLVFRVIDHEGDYLHVMVASRPNGQTGFIKASDVTLSTTAYRMELSVSNHHLKVFKGGDVFVETDVVVGKQSSKTPIGSFYLNDKVKSDNSGGAYGPWILSTSAYSEDLDIFDNGLPVIAFHGTNQPNLIGQNVSNGCIRMPNDVDQKLHDALPLGTPITINA